ncbi:hypothetical protein M378DRAFT_18189 [Amanita muscaria Koide BX008]|uniref:Uncharacterized protein n=1 Tax=Amanita muscaria (strain Koide BX008) TaxID=946122 RepID=A0A0C2RXW8_AMAMK|nr:hypothetical protein M378DRAFT_18189 [Amanita muscaria Koide BX008]
MPQEEASSAFSDGKGEQQGGRWVGYRLAELPELLLGLPEGLLLLSLIPKWTSSSGSFCFSVCLVPRVGSACMDALAPSTVDIANGNSLKEKTDEGE